MFLTMEKAQWENLFGSKQQKPGVYASHIVTDSKQRQDQKQDCVINVKIHPSDLYLQACPMPQTSHNLPELHHRMVRRFWRIFTFES